jgi:hypothetical protein
MVSLGKIDPPPPASTINNTPVHVVSGIAARTATAAAIGSMAAAPDHEVIGVDDEDDQDSDHVDDEVDPPPSTTHNDSEVILVDDEDDQDSDPVDDEVDPPPPASTTNNATHVTAGTAATANGRAAVPDPDVVEAILSLSRASEWYR